MARRWGVCLGVGVWPGQRLAGGVGVEDGVAGAGFVAGWAASAEVEALAGVVPVVAVELGEVAGGASGALVDGVVWSAGGGGHGDGGSGLGVAGAPGGLAAGGC